MTGPEVPAAVRRAAEENPNAYRDWSDAFMSGQPIEPASIYVSRRALAAALDVEEMARVLYEHTRGLLAGTVDLPPWEAAPADMAARSKERATALRAAILGEVTS